ncbi:HD domain-containing protein [Deinococcus sp.]|uniref:HD domain-containing protein n=1 Tax=Deinococcus sp. TaxID=47478 RepID=UPI003B5C37F4
MFPTLAEAERLLLDAETLNPGAWAAHSRYVAKAARRIAERHPTLDPDRAEVLGLLHDIGRRTGPNRDRHIIDGYDFLMAQGYPDAARIALTHSFVIPEMDTLQGAWDGTPPERERLTDLIDEVAKRPMTEEDRLLQLCDMLGLHDGFCTLHERLLDIALRYSVNARTPDKWQAQLQLKTDFDAACGVNVYALLPGLTERLLR